VEEPRQEEKQLKNLKEVREVREAADFLLVFLPNNSNNKLLNQLPYKIRVPLPDPNIQYLLNRK